MTMGDPADSRTEMQQAMAERAREFAAGQPVHRPQRYWVSAIGLILAALVVGTVFLGFDVFLGGMQKVIEIMSADEATPEPVPVFIVPQDPPRP
jgi:hypothetical protein